MDGKGNLCGTTAVGGACGDDTVFKLTSIGGGSGLRSFGSHSRSGLALKRAIMDKEGDFQGADLGPMLQEAQSAGHSTLAWWYPGCIRYIMCLKFGLAPALHGAGTVK
jgi:hypothetical protein